MRRRHVLIASLMLALTFVPAAAVRADDIDAYVQAEMQRQKLPGVALVVLRDGKVQKSAGYGVADREANQSVTPKTLFKIGSVSKQFIATGVMLLVQDGKLKLDDPVRTYLPDAPDAWNAITIRHLLSHTAGLVREAPAFEPFTIQPDATVVRSGLRLRYPDHDLAVILLTNTDDADLPVIALGIANRYITAPVPAAAH